MRRVRDESDRRRVIVTVTEQMLERGEIIWGPLGEEARRLFGRLTADDLRTIRSSSRRRALSTSATPSASAT